MVSNQKKICEMLKSSYKNNRLSHAYLFYGDDGVGKKEMAYYLAMIVNCQNGACMECHTCKSIMADEFINVHYIGVLEKKKLISKNQIEELQDEFAKTSLVEGPRVYIVDGIDTASVAAQNSLLKFIEEPVNGEETFGVFIAKDISNVISTIQSRCSLVYFPSMPKSVILGYLKDNDVPVKKAELISLMTNSFSEAMGFAKNTNLDKLISAIDEFLNCRDAKTGVLYLKTWNAFLADTTMLKWFFKFILALYEDMFLMYNREEIYLSSYEQSINSLCKLYSYADSKNNFEIITNLARRIDYNVVSKNILHQLFINLFRK